MSKRISRRERKLAATQAARAAAAMAGQSTGPRTAEGKATSSRNAMKEGFFCRTIHVPKGMEADFDNFEYCLQQATQPEGAIEERLFVDFLRAEWNMHRIELAQEDLAQRGLDPLLSDDQEAKRLESIYHRNRSARNSALSKLQAIQSSRLADEACPNPSPGHHRPPLAKSGDIIALANRTHPMAMEVARAKEHAAMAEAYSKTGVRPIEPLRHTDFLTPEEKEDPGKDFFQRPKRR